jgi:hypothetical protein
VEALYWRGLAYKRQGDPAAEEDLAAAAASPRDSQSRTEAALALARLYAEHSDFKSMAALYDGHDYLFDEAARDTQELSAAYEGRCFVRLRLNEMDKALETCGSALKFGITPGALEKHREILRATEHHERGT